MHFELLIGLLYERKSLIFAEELKDRGVGKEMSKEIREEKRKDERKMLFFVCVDVDAPLTRVFPWGRLFL